MGHYRAGRHCTALDFCTILSNCIKSATRLCILLTVCGWRVQMSIRVISDSVWHPLPPSRVTLLFFHLYIWTINLQALPRPPHPFCHLSLPYFSLQTKTPESMRAMDDSRSATLHEEKSSRPASRDGEKSVLPSRASVNEKETEAGVATSPHPSVKEKPEHEQEIDATEMDGHDLSKVKTSETGVEYPHGLKLGLISLALCLSVFLMALVFLHRNCSAKTSN
jgi:hypothetical protein